MTVKIYEIEPQFLTKIKNTLEAPDIVSGELGVEIEKEQGKGVMEKAKAWKINEFKRNGYILREAKTLGIDKKVSYLYISAPDDFFNRNEKLLLDLGAKVVKNKEYEEVKAKIEEVELGASSAVGFVFG